MPHKCQNARFTDGKGLYFVRKLAKFALENNKKLCFFTFKAKLKQNPETKIAKQKMSGKQDYEKT